MGSSNFGGAKLNLNSSETVAEFWIDGAFQGPGTFDSSTNPGVITGTGSIIVPVAPDVKPPLPDPMAFDVTPHGVTTTSIGMSAVMASDASGPVEYQFRRDGSFTTPWQTSLSFTDMGLTPAVSYGYEVRARDAVGNTGGWSPVFSSTPVIENVMTSAAAGGTDSWNAASNWTGGVPSGSDSAIVDMGVAAEVNTLPPSFSGNLELRDNASLHIRNQSGIGVIPSGPARLIMGDGTEIIPRTNNGGGGNIEFGSVELQGDAKIWGGRSTSGHHTTRTFADPISGPGQLTLDGVNNNTFNLDAANTFTGLTAQSTQNQSFRVAANAAGALGVGDIFVLDFATLEINAADAMSDMASLYLEGAKDSRRPSKLVLNSDDTIFALILDGVNIAPGMYDASSMLFDINNNPLITGSGILTILGPTAIPEPATTTLALLCVGAAMVRRRAVRR